MALFMMPKKSITGETRDPSPFHCGKHPFDSLPPEERQKIYFIHLNHTNPALRPESPQRMEIVRRKYHIAAFGTILEL
jgi:hypothetical protein